MAEIRAQHKPMTGDERWEFFLEDNFASPGAFFRSAWPALMEQWRDDPPDWEQGMKGYGKRAASEFASRTIQGGIEHGMAAALGHEVRYIPCPCSGFFKRFGYALASNFVTLDRQSNYAFHVSNVAGIYGGSMTRLGWYPERYSWKDGVREGSQSLLIGGSFNIFREYWRDVRKLVPFVRGR